MEHPVEEIPHLIRALTTGDPEQQEDTLRKYFLPNASFTHPFCHVPSFSKGAIPLAGGLDSLWMILGIYRWYRTLSPHIDITVDSVAFDENSGLLYVTLRQTFALWFVPLYKAPVKLVSVLQLTQKSPTSPSLAPVQQNSLSYAEVSKPNDQVKHLYYIASQEDMYPVSDTLQFLCPGLGPLLWRAWQLYSSWMCVLGSLILMPVFLLLNSRPTKSHKLKQ